MTGQMRESLPECDRPKKSHPATTAILHFEIRNPKPERNPNAEIRGQRLPPASSGLRYSDFFRISGFGLRISLAGHRQNENCCSNSYTNAGACGTSATLGYSRA